MSGGAKHKLVEQGYTIVEVLIVMAITGAMFLIAATFINGKQTTVEFRQSVTDLNTQLNSVINDVANGYYPAGQPFQCSASNGAAPTLSYAASPPGQGANDTCIFDGKLVHFSTYNSPVSYMELISVAGNRYDSSGQEVQTIQASHPQPILDLVGSPPQFDVTTQYSLTGGTSFTTVKERDSSGAVRSNDYAFAILSNLGTGINGDQLVSGARSISLYGLDNTNSLTSSTADRPTAAQKVRNIQDSDQIDSVTICLINGNHKAFITIGGNGKLTTSITWEQTCP